MKARIVDMAELKKKPEVREAEDLLQQLTGGKAIEVTVTGSDTVRKTARLFREAAKTLQKEVRVTTREKGAKVVITLKG